MINHLSPQSGYKQSQSRSETLTKVIKNLYKARAISYRILKTPSEPQRQPQREPQRELQKDNILLGIRSVTEIYI